MRLALSEVIAIPADETFSLISDFGRSLPKIDPGMLEVAKLTGGAIGVMTEWSERFTGPLRRTTAVMSRVEVFDPPRRLLVSFRTAGLNGTIEFTCESGDDDSTLLTLTMDARPTLFGWLVYPLARRDVINRERTRMRNFKRLAESGGL
jgi:hypothetical protein